MRYSYAYRLCIVFFHYEGDKMINFTDKPSYKADELVNYQLL